MLPLLIYFVTAKLATSKYETGAENCLLWSSSRGCAGVFVLVNERNQQSVVGSFLLSLTFTLISLSRTRSVYRTHLQHESLFLLT
ncbi:hypothetical protein FHG87_004799 [Trinorchestia longiramus]|nr:hypothetical protein FHG87_004799 [Trinorchestia longiramus]